MVSSQSAKLIYAGSNPVLPSIIGGLPEWFKGAVLKTVAPRGAGGSNPSASACSNRLVHRSVDRSSQGFYHLGRSFAPIP